MAKRGGPHDSKRENEIAERRAKVAELALAYVPQNQIAELLDVHPSTVSRDLAAVREQWRADAKVDVQAMALRELQSLDRLEASLWRQFTSRMTPPDTKNRTAQQILRCKERRAKMLGFDQPDLLEVRAITPEVVQAEIARLREVLGHDSARALDSG